MSMRRVKDWHKSDEDCGDAEDGDGTMVDVVEEGMAGEGEWGE